MFVLPTLVYTLLGVTIAWASPAPTPKSANAVVPRDGINCKGNGECGGSSEDATPSWTLVGYINQISDDAWYKDGQQIACTSGDRAICAFLRGTLGSNGQWIKALAPYIPAHGCKVCGSVPYFYLEKDDNVADGMLTFDTSALSCNYPDGGVCNPGI